MFADILFSLLMLLHGSIHLAGFIKSRKPSSVRQLQIAISPSSGILWLASGMILILSSVLYALSYGYWWIPAFVGAGLSQIIIAGAWADAKFGTIANVIILAGVIFGFCSWNFERSYFNDVREAERKMSITSSGILSESDIQNVPDVVKKYLSYTKSLDKPVPSGMKVSLEGELRSRSIDWFRFSSQQTNTFGSYSRLFFIKSRIFGLSTPGYHRLISSSAEMDVRLFGLFPAAYNSGVLMDTAETVTLFNDICLMAPALLASREVRWLGSGDTFAEAEFTNGGIRINARLIFDSEGRLINFLSGDRYDMSSDPPAKFIFSTPVYEYREINGYYLASRGDAIWQYHEGAFVYGRFYILNVTYF